MKEIFIDQENIYISYFLINSLTNLFPPWKENKIYYFTLILTCVFYIFF